MEEMSQDDS